MATLFTVFVPQTTSLAFYGECHAWAQARSRVGPCLACWVAAVRPMKIWNILEKLFFLQSSEQTNNLFIQRLRCMKQPCIITETLYLSNIPSNSDYWWEYFTIDHYIFAVWVIIQVRTCGWYLYYRPANRNGKLCNVLTNNLNLNWWLLNTCFYFSIIHIYHSLIRN